MKKLIWLLVLAMMVTCSAMAETDVFGAEWTAPEAGEAFSMEKDMGVVVNGVFYPVYQDVAPLLEALGTPDDQVDSPSCVFEGEDHEFDYDLYGSIYTNPIDGKDVWYEFYISADGIASTRGLKVGDTVEKMLELYGENYYVEGDGMYTYSISGVEGDVGSPCMIIESEDGIITSIDVYYPTNI